MKNLIPKSLRKQKGIFYKNVSFKDLLVLVIILAVSCGITFGMVFLSWIIRIIIALSITLIVSLFFLPSSKNNDCKLYELYYFMLKYKTTPKKYIGNQTKALCPYSEIKEHTVYTKVPLEGPAVYLKMIQVRGLDISSLDNHEANLKIEAFHNLLVAQKRKFSIAKINTKYSASMQLKYWQQMLDENKELYDHVKISEKTFKTNQEQILNQIEILKHVNETMKADKYQNNYYFILYEQNLQDLERRVNDVVEDLEHIGCFTKVLDEYQTINVIKNIYHPLSEDFSATLIDENKHELDKIFSFDEIRFKKDCMVINDKLLLSFKTVADYPFEIDNYWLAQIFLSNDANMILNAKQIEQSTALSLINKSIVNSASNEFNEKKQVQKYQYSHINAGFKQMAQDIIKNNQVVFDVNLMFVNYDVDERSLMKQNRDIKKQLQQKQIKVNLLKYRQFEALDSFLPKLHDDLMKLTGREIPSLTLAHGYPFISNTLNDPHGMTLGLDWLHKPIMFDPFLLDENRKNHNIMVLGSPGCGKSYLTKKIINWCAMTHKKVFILDVEREYQTLTNNYDGDWIDIASGKGACINPLEIILAEDTNNHELIAAHLLFLETFFQILLPELTSLQLRYLLSCIKELYYQFELDNKDLNVLKSDAYPTFSDLHNFMISKNNKVAEMYQPLDVKIVNEIIRADFIKNTKLGWIYDHHSTIDINKNLVCLDLNSLFEKNNYKLTQAQLFLALSYLQKEIRFNTKDDPSVMIVLDEAHILINEENPIGLDFVYQMVKRIRKRNGGIMIISQNPNDFMSNDKVAKKTKAIINNTQYSFFFNMSPSNIEDVTNMYKNYGSGLSEEERLFMAKAKRGQALFLTSGFDRHKTDIFVSEKESNNFNESLENE